MAEISLKESHADFADSILERFRERDILLSSYAEGLVRLSVEAWFEDSPKLKGGKGGNDLRELARDVVDRAMADPHLLKNNRGRYFDLMAALVEGGKVVLRDILGKGF